MKKAQTVFFLILSIIANVGSFLLAFLNLGIVETNPEILLFLFGGLLVLDFIIAQQLKKDEVYALTHAAFSFFNVSFFIPLEFSQQISMGWVYVGYVVSCLSLLFFTPAGKEQLQKNRNDSSKNKVFSILFLLLLPTVLSFFLGFLNKKKSV